MEEKLCTLYLRILDTPSLSYYIFFKIDKRLKSSVFNLGYRCLLQEEGPLNYPRRCYWFRAMNNMLDTFEGLMYLGYVVYKLYLQC